MNNYDSDNFEDFDLPDLPEKITLNPEPLLSYDSKYSKACLELQENLKNVEYPSSLCEKEILKCEELFSSEAFDLWLSEEYYIGCEFEVYKSTYTERLLNFKNRYVDAEDIDFIRKELDIAVLNNPYPFTNEEDTLKIKYALKKRFQFLIDQALALGYVLRTADGDELSDFNSIGNKAIIAVKNDTSTLATKAESGFTINNNINFNISELEAVELIKALMESGKIKGNTEAEVFKFFGEIFGVTIKQKQKLQTIKKRSKDLTPMLQDLILSLELWITRED